MNIPEKQQNNDDGHAPLGAAQSLRTYPTRMFGGDSVTGGRLPVAGGGELGGSVAGCITLCRVIAYRATGGNVIGGGVTLCRAIFSLVGGQQHTVFGNRVLRVIQRLLWDTF